jgi:hypothetical protein
MDRKDTSDILRQPHFPKLLGCEKAADVTGNKPVADSISSWCEKEMSYLIYLSVLEWLPHFRTSMEKRERIFFGSISDTTHDDK